MLGTPPSQKGVAPDDRVSPAGHNLRHVLLSQLLRSPRAAVTYPEALDAVRFVCVNPGVPLRHQVFGLQFCHRCCELGTPEQLDAGGVGAAFATLLLSMLEDPSLNAELRGLACVWAPAAFFGHGHIDASLHVHHSHNIHCSGVHTHARTRANMRTSHTASLCTLPQTTHATLSVSPFVSISHIQTLTRKYSGLTWGIMNTLVHAGIRLWGNWRAESHRDSATTLIFSSECSVPPLCPTSA